MSITLDDMRAKLLSLSEVRETLAESEPLAEYNLDEGNVHFVLGDSWNHGIDATEGSQLVDAYVTVGGNEIQMSKDAVLQATALCGLTGAYVKKAPSRLIEPDLNYWYGEQGIGNRPAKVLVTKGHAAAVTRQSIRPFSNLKLLYNVVDGVQEKYGDAEILVDTKFHHALAGTHLRLILPTSQFTIQDTDIDDDNWFVGLNLFNSLTGKGKTSINGYLFRWWCTNGAIDTKAASGTWTRSAGEDGLDVYDWARETVRTVLEPMEGSAHRLQEMAHMSIEGDVVQTLQDLFDDYKLPARDQKRVVDQMVEEDNLTMYHLMQAITNAANDVTDPNEQAKLMSVGGDLTRSAKHRCGECHRLTQDV